MKIVYAVFAFLVFCATSFAEVPEQKLISPEKVDAGEIVIVDVTPVKNAPATLKTTSYSWKVLEVKNNAIAEKKIITTPNGILFGAGIKPKKFFVIVDITYLFVENTSYSLENQSLSTTIEIVGGSVDPEPSPPSPPPTPEPEPQFEQGKYNLAALSYRWVKNYVPTGAQKRGSVALSSSFSSVASAISAGTLKDIKDILTNSKESNNEALKNAGVSQDLWNQFGEVLQKTLFQLYQDKKLVTPEDFSTAFREISEGLSKVK